MVNCFLWCDRFTSFIFGYLPDTQFWITVVCQSLFQVKMEFLGKRELRHLTCQAPAPSWLLHTEVIYFTSDSTIKIYLVLKCTHSSGLNAVNMYYVISDILNWPWVVFKNCVWQWRIQHSAHQNHLVVLSQFVQKHLQFYPPLLFSFLSYYLEKTLNFFKISKIKIA